MNSTANNIKLSKDVERILKVSNATVGGQLNFALRWNNTNDLDLYVETPAGKTISYKNKKVKEGKLDADKNIGRNISNSPIENIRWEKNAPSGTYKIFASIHSLRSGLRSGNTNYNLVVHKNGQAFKSFSGKVSHSKLKKKNLIATMNFSNQ